MCGIAGEVNWENNPDPKVLEGVVSAMIHRGPDAGALESLDNIVLGHRRLSVIDTRSVANQPMWDSDRSACIVFNGEIYNFGKLRKDLESQGFIFQTSSDTEVILNAYLRWDIGCLQKLIGMFAFAIWDCRKQRLFIGRDRMGEKPLFYFESKSGMVFASELKALKQHPACPLKINPQVIGQFLSLNYILTDSCILDGVKKLPPAYFLLCDKGQSPQIKQYWSLKDSFINKPCWANYKEAQDHLNDLLDEVLAGQLIADVPLGAFLSGGIDSSTIVAHMARLAGTHRTNTYSIGFAEQSYNELPESKAVASVLGVDHHAKSIYPRINELMSDIVVAFDEPFADSSMIPTYFLCGYARKQVTVALSGDGGDELFLGYETYLANKIHHSLSFIPDTFIGLSSRLVDRFWPVSFEKVSFDYKIRQFLKGMLLPFDKAHCQWRNIFSEEEKARLLIDRSMLSSNPMESFSDFFADVAVCHYLDQASYVDMKTWLVDDILVKVDRAAMIHSLETRTPFLDHRIVEFAAGLPVSWKLKGATKKAILKSSQEKYLPKSVLYRQKRGFNAPVSDWLKGEMMPLGKQATYDTPLQNWVNRSYVDQLWYEHEKKLADNGLKLFGLTCLGLWLEQHNNHINRAVS